METLDGPPFDLVKERGKIVVMNVFATWCPPCRSEQPGFVTAAHRYVERGVSVVGVNDREADDAVRAYRKQFSIDYPIAMDRKGILTWNLEVDNRSRAVLLPVTFFLLRSGQLSCYKRGWMSDEELSYRIEAMLSDDDVAPSPTPK